MSLLKSFLLVLYKQSVIWGYSFRVSVCCFEEHILLLQLLPVLGGYLFTELGFRVGFSSWIFELDLELDFPVGF